MSNINIKIPDSVDAVIDGLTKKPSQSIGDTLADCWFLVFGGLSEKAEKKRLKIAYDLKIYQSDLEQAIRQIPPENQQEAKLCVVGPALEKSKYCVEETKVRDMFVQLIAHSMDNRYSSIVHPSFPEIISQMSPLDAENIKLFNNDQKQLPIAEYRYIFGNNNYQTIQTNAFLSNPNMQDIDIQASSVSVLTRLGLITTTYIEYSTNKETYLPFEQQPLFVMAKEFVIVPIDGFKSPRDDKLIHDVIVQNGLAILTPLGKDFLKVCL